MSIGSYFLSQVGVDSTGSGNSLVNILNMLEQLTSTTGEYVMVVPQSHSYTGLVDKYEITIGSSLFYVSANGVLTFTSKNDGHRFGKFMLATGNADYIREWIFLREGGTERCILTDSSAVKIFYSLFDSDAIVRLSKVR